MNHLRFYVEGPKRGYYNLQQYSITRWVSIVIYHYLLLHWADACHPPGS